MPNRLAESTSPYLRQHADNPVDWQEWGDDAFAEARRRDVPLLISTGYSACHWCHVMAHESFEDEATAAYMNEHFVNVKVDREERPDVDAVYMEATQAMTGRGGWPMTVFATPDGEPFYCGTYFPPRAVQGMPSFGQVLRTLADAWQTRRGEIDSSASAIREALGSRGPSTGLPHGEVVREGPLDRALAELARDYDAHRGGFGAAPKFPPSMLLEWLLRHSARTGSEQALQMAGRTLEAMARGGMYDQLGGGFARYAVDADWVVPHFEKMLYDNALLLRVYAHWWRATGSPLARRVVTETADWLMRELRTPQGGFASALDADSGGREGAFSVWTPAQLVDVLGEQDGAWAAAVFSVTPAGTFEHGASVLQLLMDPDEPRPSGGGAPGSSAPADDGGGSADTRGAAAVVRYASIRARLFAAREERPRPARDDKVVAAWNGLAIAGLADAGALLERPDWVAAARVAAELVIELHLHRVDGDLRLARTSRDGVVGSAPGVLEDYADLAEGLLALYQATGEDRWVAVAGDLLDEVLGRFGDGEGGYYDTAVDQTDAVLAAIRRPRDPADGPTPSGQAAAAGALLTYAALTGSRDHREAAVGALTEPVLLASRHPRASGWGLAVAEAVIDGPREVAVVGTAGDPGTTELVRIARHATAPGAVVAVGGPDHIAPLRGVALLAERPMVDGRATAYVCRGFVCDRPTNEPAELARQLTTTARTSDASPPAAPTG